MDFLIEIIKTIDLGQLIVIAGMLWYTYSRLNSKIEKLELKLENKIDKIDSKLNDIDKRVFAIETMLHMKDCCMLKDERKLKQAE